MGQSQSTSTSSYRKKVIEPFCNPVALGYQKINPDIFSPSSLSLSHASSISLSQANEILPSSSSLAEIEINKIKQQQKKLITNKIQTEQDAIDCIEALDIEMLNQIAIERKWWKLLAAICKLPHQHVKFGSIVNFKSCTYPDMESFVDELISCDLSSLTCTTNDLLFFNNDIKAAILDSLYFRNTSEASQTYIKLFESCNLSSESISSMLLEILRDSNIAINDAQEKYAEVSKISRNRSFINCTNMHEALNIVFNKFELENPSIHKSFLSTMFPIKRAYRTIENKNRLCHQQMSVFYVAVRVMWIPMIENIASLYVRTYGYGSIPPVPSSILKLLLCFSFHNQIRKDVWIILKKCGIVFDDNDWFIMLQRMGYIFKSSLDIKVEITNYYDQEEIYWQTVRSELANLGTHRSVKLYDRFIGSEVLFQLALEDKDSKIGKITIIDFIHHIQKYNDIGLKSYQTFIKNLFDLLLDKTIVTVLSITDNGKWTTTSQHLIETLMSVDKEKLYSEQHPIQDRLINLFSKFENLSLVCKLQLFMNRPHLTIPDNILEERKKQYKSSIECFEVAFENVDLFNLYKNNGLTDIIKVIVLEKSVCLQLGLITDTDINTPSFFEPLKLACIRNDIPFLNLMVDNIAFDSDAIWKVLYHKHCLEPVKRWMHTKMSLNDQGFLLDASKFKINNGEQKDAKTESDILYNDKE